MRRIEFIAPVDAMRGNLSGNQKLTYPTQNNSAWESPSGKVNYATNYQPRYVGAKRAKTGLKLFSVRTKSAVNMSPQMRLQMALLSVSSVFADCIMKDLSTLTDMQDYFLASPEREKGWTFKRWIMYYVRVGLKGKTSFFFNKVGESSIIYHNPFTGNMIEGAHELSGYPSELIWKFALELGPVGLQLFNIVADGDNYQFYGIPGRSFLSQYGENATLDSDNHIARIVKGSLGVVTGSWIAESGAQLKFMVGAWLNGLPVYYVSGSTETAVQSSDNLVENKKYIAKNS